MSETTKSESKPRITPRMVLGLLIAVLAVVFIAGNREPTEISLAVLRISAPLWVTLTGVFLAGLATGWLVARRRK